MRQSGIKEQCPNGMRNTGIGVDNCPKIVS